MGKVIGDSQMLACVHFVFKMYTKIPGIYVE